eukprot:Phypoly_transcript_07152.p2 GENE.Phypoly_transcript_07152~~Phypoly_transcript_07152.p2  ORF type:complete len:123 (+),score=20.70 Phypoly_transcript_07152:462-830(+)
MADVSISASFPIPQALLQRALKEEHKLQVVSRATVISDINLPAHLIHTWVVTYSTKNGDSLDDKSAIALNQDFASLPHVLHVSVFYKEKQHTIVASSSFDSNLISSKVAEYSGLSIATLHQK